MNKPDLSKIGAVTAGKTKTTGISPFSELEITKVYPNPDQPRKQFDDIEELASSIKEHELLQPIVVVKRNDKYMIVDGERRYRAHLYNKTKTIKAYIVDLTDEAIEEITLIANIQRNDLTDFEIAKHICKLWDSGRYEKKSDLAAKIGKSDSYISKSFNCLKLDSEIIDHIEQNKTPISIGVMDEIARVKDKGTQKEVFKKYNNGEITRDDIKDFKEPKKTIKEKVEEIFIKPPISCNYVEENIPIKTNDFPWEKTYSEQHFYVSDFEKQLTQAFKDGYRQPFKEIKMKNAYEQKIHDLLLEQDTKYIDDCVDSINESIKRNGYKKEEHGKIYLYAPGYHVRLRNRYGEIIFDLLKENLELKKEIEEFKKSSNEPQVQEPIKDDKVKDENKNCLKDKKDIALLELLKEAVVIHYTNYEIDMGIDYKEAKKIIAKSKQDSIPFNAGKGTDERAYRLINTDIRTIKDDCIVLIPSS